MTFSLAAEEEEEEAKNRKRLRRRFGAGHSRRGSKNVGIVRGRDLVEGIGTKGRRQSNEGASRRIGTHTRARRLKRARSCRSAWTLKEMDRGGIVEETARMI